MSGIDGKKTLYAMALPEMSAVSSGIVGALRMMAGVSPGVYY